MLIATALDAHLPALRQAVKTRTSDVIDGCDIADQPPYLCIGSTGDNVYTANVALSIDLGGNDTYRNNAGGGSLVWGTGFSLPGVSVSIDLAGDDRYTPELSFSTGGWSYRIANGAGYFAGVGVLVDVMGNDLYSASAPPAPAPGYTSYLIAQGSANNNGTGALFDLSGSDRYVAAGSDSSRDAVHVYAQGSGKGGTPAGSRGALVDLGLGNDQYDIAAGTVEGAAVGPESATVRPERTAAGQGLGDSVGTGVLVDDGGTDEFTLSASARWEGPDAYPLNYQAGDGYTKLPQTTTWGQGRGAIGVGLLLTGPGDTTYRAVGSGTGIAHNAVSVQGIGNAGIGILDDLSGHDTYEARAGLSYDHEIRVDDSCAQPDPEGGGTRMCPSASAVAGGLSPGDFAELLYSQGYGALAGVGMISDHLGDDTYTARVDESFRVRLADELTEPEDPAFLYVYGYGPSWNIGQGMGQGFGYGILRDEGGSDEYTARSFSVADGDVSTTNAEGEPEVLGVSRYRVGMWQQGAGMGIEGLGALLDLGGNVDRFKVVSQNPLVVPDPSRAIRYGTGIPLAQGAAGDGNADGVFGALGLDPIVTASPARPVCPLSPGQRGSGAWSDCAVYGQDANSQPSEYKALTPTLGNAPSAGALVPSLTILPETPDHARPGFIEVVAALSGPDGAPLAGRQVSLTFQVRRGDGDPTYGDVWHSGPTIDAVTGPDGVVRASLLAVDWLNGNPAYQDFRVGAAFDGEEGQPGLAARFAGKAFQLDT